MHIIWGKLLSTECTADLNWHHTQLHPLWSGSWYAVSISKHPLSWTAVTKWVDWYFNKVQIFSLIVTLSYFRICCCTSINKLTAQLWLTIRDLSTRYNIPLPSQKSYRNIITPGPTMLKVKRVTIITPSNAQFLLSRYFFSAGLHLIALSNFRSVFPPEQWYWHVVTGKRWLKNWYYILMLRNMWWQLQQIQRVSQLGWFYWYFHPRCQSDKLEETYISWTDS